MIWEYNIIIDLAIEYECNITEKTGISSNVDTYVESSIKISGQ